MGWALALVASLAIVACSSNAARPPSADPSLLLAARAETSNGRFELALEVQRTAWRADESISALATLDLTEPGSTTVWGSGGNLFGFEFTELGGSGRHIEPIWPASCGPHQIDLGAPLMSDIQKSGHIEETDPPNADFFRDFFSGPEAHLPAGDWQVGVTAIFHERAECAGPQRMMTVSLLIHVTG